MRTTTIHAWMTTIAESVKDRRDYLTLLAAAIGDGDHGVNLARGFEAVGTARAAQDASLSPGKILIVAGKTLVSTVGGASGPLWGTAFRRAGRALGDKQELDGQDLVVALRAGLEGVVDLGAAQPGDKTMVDALGPAIDALAAALDSGEPLEAALSTATEAAESGAKATVPLSAAPGQARPPSGMPPVRSTVRLAAGEVRRLTPGWWLIPATDLAAEVRAGTDLIFGTGTFEADVLGSPEPAPSDSWPAPVQARAMPSTRRCGPASAAARCTRWQARSSWRPSAPPRSWPTRAGFRSHSTSSTRRNRLACHRKF